MVSLCSAARRARATLLALAAWPAVAAAKTPPHLRGTMHTIPGGVVITPASNRAPPGYAHTNLEILVPGAAETRAKDGAPSGPYETPASLACVYGLTEQVAGCNPETLSTVATGGSRVVVVVDAFDDPHAAADLGTFSATFGLPPVSDANFEVIYELGEVPPQDPSGLWELEESLDIEMAHALAPGANIVLIEAQSNSTWDLAIAEGMAQSVIAEAGGGEVSNSWDSAEFDGENGWADSFHLHHAVVFAAAGDSPGPGFPSVLPNVVSVGGTTIERDGQGNYQGQVPWAATGGGASQYMARPNYQDAVQAIVGGARGTPDIAFDADPASGVWIYDSVPLGGTPPGWTVVGGTSVASPALAAIVNNAGSFAPKTRDELKTLYATAATSGGWIDIAAGSCGNGQALAGYDLCTGLGIPWGRAGK